MSQEWYYTKDRKGKFGPVSAVELRTLLESGSLQPTDMVWKQGMKEWVPVSAIEDVLFGGSANVGRIVAKLSLPVAAALSLLAGLLAVLGVSIAAAVIAGLAILPGLIAVAVGFSSGKNLPYLASGGTAAFIGVGALLFSIGATIWKGRIEEARQTVAKAAEVEKDREKAEAALRKAREEVEEDRAKAEAARRKAREDREAAETALVEARRPVKEYLDREKAILEKREKGAKTLEDELVKRQKELDAKGRDLEAKEKEADIKLFEAKKKFDDAREMENAAKEREKKATATLKLAEDADREAKANLEDGAKKLVDAEKKELEVLEHHKKIADEYKKLGMRLHDPDPKKWKPAISAVARVGPLPSSVPLDVSEIYTDLCLIAAFNVGKARDHVLDALEKIKPGFGSLVRDLIYSELDFKNMAPTHYPLTERGLEGMRTGVQRLPTFGTAGLPVIQWHLQANRETFKELTWRHINNYRQCQAICDAEIKALAEIARGSKEETKKRVIELLAKVPDSELAKSCGKMYREEIIRPRIIKLLPGLSAGLTIGTSEATASRERSAGEREP